MANSKESTKNAETQTKKTEAATVEVKAPRGKKLPKVTVITSPKAASRQVTGSVNGFVEFLREHAIVGLAVGFVLATQVQAVVKQLIASFIDPLFQLIVPGNKSLNDRTFTLHFNGHYANFGWGALAYAFIDFLFIAATIYAIIKIFNLDQLDKKK
jgi:large-conductance mechanosensitive channel